MKDRKIELAIFWKRPGDNFLVGGFRESVINLDEIEINPSVVRNFKRSLKRYPEDEFTLTDEQEFIPVKESGSTKTKFYVKKEDWEKVK